MFPKASELHLHPYRSKDRVALIQIERRTWKKRKVQIERNMGNARQSSKEGPDQSKEHERRRKAIDQAKQGRSLISKWRMKEVALDG
jgi:hypothetical protein